MSPQELVLPEWRTAKPAKHAVLQGLSLEGYEGARELATWLDRKQMLHVGPGDGGLAVRTRAFVGSVTVGPLRITITPKVGGSLLIKLLRYAYRLRNLGLYEQHQGATAAEHFQDLLLHQLAEEAEELFLRGLHRRYKEQRQSLPVPRGRIHFGRMAAGEGLLTAALPCRFHDRDEDCLPNRVLLAGLHLGGRLACDEDLAARLRQLARHLGDSISEFGLDRATVVRLRRERSRLLSAYDAALALIQLLVEGAGATVASQREARLPGFLFDMNRFFERLLERFLTENLPDAEVLTQEPLRGLFAYDKAAGRRAPRPRPDFVVRCHGRHPAVLDAKYRDLWEEPLPREMLYQLALYALGQPHQKESAILYPTVDEDAIERRIFIKDPQTGRPVGSVALRPVRLGQLAELLARSSPDSEGGELQAFARQLAFGPA